MKDIIVKKADTLRYDFSSVNSITTTTACTDEQALVFWSIPDNYNGPVILHNFGTNDKGELIKIY